MKDNRVTNLRDLIQESKRAQQRAREIRRRAEELIAQSERLFTRTDQVHYRAGQNPPRKTNKGQSKVQTSNTQNLHKDPNEKGTLMSHGCGPARMS